MDSGRKNLGVVGHPIRHSLSAVMHNAVFRELRLDYNYRAFDVEKKDLMNFIEGCREHFLGLNVTIPHKVGVMGFLDEVDEGAQLVGAVNTVKFSDEGAKGFNTDGIGCMRALQEAGVSIRNKEILVLGAGGAARAISFQLVSEGASVSITNRELERYMAEGLCRDIKEKLGVDAEIIDFSIEEIKNKLRQTDILINTTPVGMHPETGVSVIPAEIIPRDVAVMDIVYNPVETKLLKEAKEKGCRTVNGVGMLVHQGAESLKIWMGINAPIKIMENAVLDELTHD